MPLKLLRLAFALFLWCGISTAAEAACTTSSGPITFARSSSYDVLAGSVPQVSGSAGLACTGAVLSLLSSNTAKATVTSANSFKLSAGGSDTIPYRASADAGGTVVFTQGSTVDYMSGSILTLLGLGNSPNFTASIYTELTASPNVAAGTYTDVLTVNWDYSVCTGLQVLGACVGRDEAKVTITITVTLVVGKDCRITASNISFGSAALVSQFAAVTQAALVDCTKGSAYNVAFSSGQNGSARPWRAMTNGAGSSLQYNLYRPDGTTIWDETNPLPSATRGTGSTTPNQVQSFVAKVNPAQVTPPAGNYTDTINIILTF